MLIINYMPEVYKMQVIYVIFLVAYKLGAFVGFAMFGAILVRHKAYRKISATQVGA